MICIYGQNSTPEDWATQGLGVLVPSECKISVTAGAEDELQMTHPMDPQGRWKLIAEERVIRVPIPSTVIPASVSGAAPDYWQVKPDTTGYVYQQAAASYTVSTPIYPEYVPNQLYQTGDCVTYNNKSYRSKVSNAAGAPTIASGFWEEIPTPTETRYYTTTVTVPAGEQYRLLAQTNNAWQRIKTKNGDIGYIQTDEVEHVEHDDPENVAERIIDTQCYRIHTVTIDHEKMALTVEAQHISYDFAANLCGSCILEHKTVPYALGVIQDSCLMSDNRLLATNITGNDAPLITADYSWQNPIYALLDPDIGLVQAAKARLIRDNRDLFLVKNDDETIQYELRYGKNLLGVSWKRASEDLVTRIIPIGQDKNGNDLLLPEISIDSEHISDHPQVYMEYLKVDCKEGESGVINGSEVSNLTKAQCYTIMRQAAHARFTEDHVDEIQTELSVSFIHLGDTEEYRQYQGLETLNLYDRVLIHDAPVGLRASAQVTSYVWNCLSQRYESITLGDVYHVINCSLAGYDLDKESVRFEKLHPSVINKIRSGMASKSDLSQTSSTAAAALNKAGTAIDQTDEYIRMTAGQLEEYHAELEITASQIRSEVVGSINGVYSNITETASSIRSEVNNTVSGLNAAVTQTASQIRIELSDNVNSLKSSITQTASQIRTELSTNANSLKSTITQTASQIRTELSDNVNSLKSSITQTASQIRTELSTNVNSLKSSITQTASQIRSEVNNSFNGVYSYVDQQDNSIRQMITSSTHVYSQLADPASSAGGSHTPTEGDIWIEDDGIHTWNEMAAKTWSELSSNYEWRQLAGSRGKVWTNGRWEPFVDHGGAILDGTRIDQAEKHIALQAADFHGQYAELKVEAKQIQSQLIDVKTGYKSSITQTASQIRSEVSDSINSVNSSITQTASQIRSEVSNNINSVKSSITQTASQIRSEVSNSINGLNSSITQNESRIALVVNTSNNTIKAAEIVSAINSGASTVQISADHIKLSGDTTLTGALTITNGALVVNKGATFMNNVTVFSGKTLSTGTLQIVGTGSTEYYNITASNAQKFITDLQIISSGTDGYKLQKKTLYDSSKWTDVSSFSRSALISGSWSGNTYTAAASSSGSNSASTSILLGCDTANASDHCNIYAYHDNTSSSDNIVKTASIYVTEMASSKAAVIRWGGSSGNIIAHCSTQNTWDAGYAVTDSQIGVSNLSNHSGSDSISGRTSAGSLSRPQANSYIFFNVNVHGHTKNYYVSINT